MVRKAKKSGSGAGVTIVALTLVILFAPKGGWTFFFLFLLVCVLIAHFGRKKGVTTVSTAVPSRSEHPSDQRSSVSMTSRNIGKNTDSDDEFLTVTLSPELSTSSYRIASPQLETSPNVRWISVGETIEIGGAEIAGGMFYLGVSRRSEANSLDGCVLNPKASVARGTAGPTAGLDTYWPTYAAFSPEQRRAYLMWLASDRSDPLLHRSFGAFYLYGIERRLLVDGVNGKVSLSEYEGIANELRRIQVAYPPLAQMAGIDRLLDLVFVQSVHPGRLYKTDPRTMKGDFEVPLSIRVAFGQAAVDRAPVPPEWAIAWAMSDPAVSKRTPVSRCADEFRQLFMRKYQARFHDGITFAANKTKLKVAARTAFPALQNVQYPEFVTTLPDIAAVSGPRNKLQQLVDECCESLDAYSRFLGRNPEAQGTLEGALLLPVELWSENARQELETLVTSVATVTVVTTFGSLFERFKASGNLTRDKLIAFSAILGESGVAIEPDVRMTSRTPKSAEYVALYSAPPTGTVTSEDETYQTVALMVDMAAALAMADGVASDREVALIHHQIQSWVQLTQRQQTRLKARAAVQIAQPATLTTLKKRLEPLSSESKLALAALLVRTANADGFVSPGEVKMLEKLYSLLGLEPQRLYADLHGGAAAAMPQSRVTRVPAADLSNTPPPAFALDTARIAALQKEMAKVSALLAGVFTEEAPAVEPVQAEIEMPPASSRILGLDDVHSTFLRLLVSRPSWTRSELTDAASDLDLMLDGAIEMVNEASLDHWDEPLIDGEDPVEINMGFAQRLTT
jgi:uncharacterized tellurite resistance protein B-like protein